MEQTDPLKKHPKGYLLTEPSEALLVWGDPPMIGVVPSTASRLAHAMLMHGLANWLKTDSKSSNFAPKAYGVKADEQGPPPAASEAMGST
jgi:hypothetical protein